MGGNRPGGGDHWTIPAEKINRSYPILCQLSRQALEDPGRVKGAHGGGPVVFLGDPHPAMSGNVILARLRGMGYNKDQMTGHGFRAMARTLLTRFCRQEPEFIEHQLAHAVRDPLGRAYNRTAHLEERRRMMQTWADYLDGLKSGAKVIPLRRAEG